LTNTFRINADLPNTFLNRDNVIDFS